MTSSQISGKQEQSDKFVHGVISGTQTRLGERRKFVNTFSMSIMQGFEPMTSRRRVLE